MYIDTDMIVEGDIAEICNVDLDGYGLAAVPYLTEELKPQESIKYKKKFGLSQNHIYFNSGLLLIDCDYWRQHNISQILMEKTGELHDKLEMPDQDILNIVFKENYKILPKQYNLIVDTTMMFFNIKEYIQSLKGCYVLHYTGGKEVRPWLHVKVPEYQKFWNIAKKTPFYNDLVIELMFNFMDRMEHKNGNTKLVKLFGFIPFLKIRTKNGIKSIRKIYYLFNFIPLFKTKELKK